MPTKSSKQLKEEQAATDAFHKSLGAEQKAINKQKDLGHTQTGAERTVANEEKTSALLENQKRADEMVQQVIQEKIDKSPVDTAKEIPVGGKAPNAKAPVSGIPVLSEFAQGAELRGQTSQNTDLFRKIQSGEATSQEIKKATGRFQLDDFDMEVIKAGEADISKTGQLIESIPFIPRELTKLTSAFGTPSKKVDEIIKNLDGAKDNIVTWTDLAKSNPAGASKYITLINDKEQQILRMESQIKIISIQSPDIKANPEQIISITQKINDIKGSVQSKREELMLLGLR